MLNRLQFPILTRTSRLICRYSSMTNQSAVTNVNQGATPTFKVKLLNEFAKAPTRGSASAAGYDIYR